MKNFIGCASKFKIKEHFSYIMVTFCIAAITIMLTEYYTFAEYRTLFDAFEDIPLWTIILLFMGIVFLFVRDSFPLHSNGKRRRRIIFYMLEIFLYAYISNAIFAGRWLNLIAIGAFLIWNVMSKRNESCKESCWDGD